MKRKTIMLLCLGLFSAIPALLLGQSAPAPAPLKVQIEEILADSLLQKGITGIRVIDAASGEVLFERNDDKYFPPASNMKLITTAGALFLLKPEFTYATPLLTNGGMRGDTLTGDIIICGKGDPTLTPYDMDEIAQQVALRSISVIEGDMLFDDTYFDTIPYGPGWMWDDLPYGFSAPICALSVNSNTISLSLTSGNTHGEPLRISMLPATAPVLLKNHATTGTAKSISVTTTFEDGINVITINGTLPPNAGPYHYTRSINTPSCFTASLLAQALEKQHIAVTGSIRRGQAAGAHDTLFIHRSEPLIKILYDLDKHSSNFIAEHILKTIGAEVIGTPGTSEKGIQATLAYFKEHAIVSDSIIQRDGSGLSRYNLITPQQITSILHYLYYSFACGPELMVVLPVSGADGTLKGRMDDEQTSRKVRAKTGTMTHVSSLSGYCCTASGRILIFSIMMKDLPAPAPHARAVQDRIVTALIESL